MNRLTSRRIVFCIIGPLACLAVLAMGGCASTGAIPPAGQATAAPNDGGDGWWYENFTMDWPQGENPPWYMDCLVANEVVKPVLNRYRKDILLWRFHRRAVRDKSGDQFGFIFYTTAPNARKIYAAIGSNPILRQLKAKGLVVQVFTDNTDKTPRPNIQDTSDPSWSLPLQKAWPYFIMGASQTWLDLISQYADGARKKPCSISEMQAFYRKIDRKVDATWRTEGGHAFLHHLDAIFGYGPLDVVVRRKVEIQF